MQKSCNERIGEAFEETMKDIRTLWNVGSLYNYGLSIEHVDGYYRYLISWGGPSREFRVYENGDVEFWFLDWYDGASIPVFGEDAEIIKEIIRMKYPDAKI